MITVEKSRSLRGLAIAGALVVVAAGAYWAFAPSGEGVLSKVTDNEGNGMWPGMGNSASVGGGAAPDLNPPLLANGRPSDVNEEDWNALEAALKRQPNAKEEASRIVSYMRYQKAFETWQNLDEQRDARKRHQMAESLMAELPERLKSGEFTLVEATLMGVVLIADSEPDEAKRTQRAEAWQAKVATMVQNPEDEAQMAVLNRETEFRRRRASAFGDWQAKTDPAERSPAKLSQAMEDVQRLYNTGGTSN